jgi:glycosyltransferase involved in cell wall biosynthesis
VVKKILIFSLAYYPHVGGAEVAVKELTDRMADLEFHMVTLRFSPNDLAYEKVGNVHVYRVGKGSSSKWAKFVYQFSAAREAERLHTEQKFDATWAVMAHSAGVPAALFKKHYPHVPYILNLQEGDPPEYIERTMRPLWFLFVRAFTLADVVQPLSNFLAAWARRMGYKGPIEIIPNGVDAKKFVGGKVPHERVVLVTSSRLVHKNAVDTILRALPLLPPYVQLVVAGTGPEESMLKKLVVDLKVEQRVEFKGFVPHSELPALLHASDTFIRPSRSEGQGASFIEAMAAGLPVIATQVGGIADFLFDAKRNPGQPTTGWAVDVDSLEQIAAAVNDIVSNPSKAAAVVETAKALAVQKYDWDIIAQDMRSKVFSRFV